MTSATADTHSVSVSASNNARLARRAMPGRRAPEPATVRALLLRRSSAPIPCTAPYVQSGHAIGLARPDVGTYARPVTTTAERLRDASAKTDIALASVRADQGASPVLIAVIGEFATKAAKATRSDDERTAVIEFEQAGDSAKAAVEADAGVSDATRQAVLDAHLAICVAKAKL